MPSLDRLAQALEITDEARVVTLGVPPYKIVHTNKGASSAPRGPCCHHQARNHALAHSLSP